ncbi:unnamed protein product [Caenorhabditis bovis]|uniref:SCP2 domain-containing protein n=1 Tax=Caenorhabditis bovis TaxID=2654633 RepID=A0A8S1ESZ8_9PELO|nr:unnamed protein product [Caenorhabditis bovis]
MVTKDELSSNFLFEIMSTEIAEGKHDALKKIKGVVEFHITVGGVEKLVYTFDLRSFPGTVKPGPSSVKPNSVITVEDENFVKLCLGEIEPVQGFLTKKFSVRGDILLMQKLNTVMRGVRKNLL